MVINGPEAMAGFMSNLFKTKGVIVPIKEANITTENNDNETVNDKLTLTPSTNNEPPNAKIPAISALNKATLRTLKRRSPSGTSIPDLSAKLCTINEEDWSDTMPAFLTGDFCDECKDLGYCKKYGPMTDHINDKSPYDLQSHKKKPEKIRINKSVRKKVK